MKRIPRATYRLQFNREFTFRQASEIIGYLDELGISDVYASPLFEAGPQSTHGYDICCFGKINPNLGTVEDFGQLTETLKERGLGLLLDFVPNHMSATLSNAWWLDVLEKGRGSPYEGYFDIDWEPGKVLLPALEDCYEKVLEDGRLRLVFQDRKFSIFYHDRRFPVDVVTLPVGAADKPEDVLREFNGVAGQEASFEKLDDLIRRQHYRLADWKEGAKEINFRRFFDVVELVALKMELPEVFRATHQLVFEWLADGKISGLRVDHVDGLWEPKDYLEQLQQNHPTYVLVEKILSGDEQLLADWAVDGTTGYEFLNRVNGLFVDGRNESVFDRVYREFTVSERSFEDIVFRCKRRVLLKSFSAELGALVQRLHGLAEEIGGGFELSQCHAALEKVIASFPVYRTYIAENTSEVSAQDRAAIRKAMRAARERAGSDAGAQSDAVLLDFIERILLLEMGGSAAREFVMKFQQLTAPAMAKGFEDTAFYRFNRLVSLNEVGGDPGKFGVTLEEFHVANAFVAKHWPHTMLATATHDTKRGEDVRARLNVLSEMPDEWRDAVVRWSQWNADKKIVVRGEPVPDANDEYLFYQTLVGAWPLDGDLPEGLRLFRDRVLIFMAKAVREAKKHTSWSEPNAAYESSLRKFVEDVLSGGNSAFLDDLRRFQSRVAFFGRFNSLAQTLLKITSPGVPDFYQGSELWDLSLVDPDNRRSVGYGTRRELLSELQKKFSRESDPAELLSELLRDTRPGAVKMFLIWRALNFRKAHREFFDSGDYVLLSAVGEKRQHVCSFARVWKGQQALVVVPRLVFGLTRGAEVPPTGREVWKDAVISVPFGGGGEILKNVLTLEEVPVMERDGVPVIELAETLKMFPVALLERL